MARFYDDEDVEKLQREHPNATTNESLAFLAGVFAVLDRVQSVVTYNRMIIVPKDEDDEQEKPTNIIIFPEPDA